MAPNWWSSNSTRIDTITTYVRSSTASLRCITRLCTVALLSTLASIWRSSLTTRLLPAATRCSRSTWLRYGYGPAPNATSNDVCLASTTTVLSPSTTTIVWNATLELWCSALRISPITNVTTLSRSTLPTSLAWLSSSIRISTPVVVSVKPNL